MPIGRDELKIGSRVIVGFEGKKSNGTVIRIVPSQRVARVIRDDKEGGGGPNREWNIRYWESRNQWDCKGAVDNNESYFSPLQWAEVIKWEENLDLVPNDTEMTQDEIGVLEHDNES